MPIEGGPSDADPLAPVIVKNKSGASATVRPYGATITSLCTKSGRELIFVSSLAKLDGSKAIRGGIPLVSPQFGQPDKSMPQHGFLRCNIWKVGNAFDDGDAACCEFLLSLKDVVKARGGKWDVGSDLDCEVKLLVKVEDSKFTTTLTFTNTGTTLDFEFQSLFHTYYKVDAGRALDKDVCFVKGLDGWSVEDKVTNEEFVQSDEPIVVDREVDRIYSNPSKSDLDVVLNSGEGTRTRIQASAVVDGVSTPVSVVVWNPFIEKAKSLGDFGDEQYHDMICIEPGILKNVPALGKGGKKAVFEQVITAM